MMLVILFLMAVMRMIEASAMFQQCSHDDSRDRSRNSTPNPYSKPHKARSEYERAVFSRKIPELRVL